MENRTRQLMHLTLAERDYDTEHLYYRVAPRNIEVKYLLLARAVDRKTENFTVIEEYRNINELVIDLFKHYSNLKIRCVDMDRMVDSYYGPETNIFVQPISKNCKQDLAMSIMEINEQIKNQVNFVLN